MIPLAIRAALAPFAPPQSEVQLTDAERLEIDRAMLADKQNDGYAQRNQTQAMKLQMDYQIKTGVYL